MSNKQALALKNIKVRVNDSDFSDALTVTRTLFKDLVSKTSIVESTLACASASCVKSNSISVTNIASFIVKNLNVSDCFHKRESNKNNDALKSTILRVRHHVKDTIKVNHIADTLYSFDAQSDSIVFTEKYIETCKTDIAYRKKVSALIQRVKRQYNAKTSVVAEKIVNAELAQLQKNVAQQIVKKSAIAAKLNINNAEHALFLKSA